MPSARAAVAGAALQLASGPVESAAWAAAPASASPVRAPASHLVAANALIQGRAPLLPELALVQRAHLLELGDLGVKARERRGGAGLGLAGLAPLLLRALDLGHPP